MDDSEFTAYLAARWPALVRTLVFLGHEVVGRHRRKAKDPAPAAHPDRLEIGGVAEVRVERVAQQRPCRHELHTHSQRGVGDAGGRKICPVGKRRPQVV